MKPKRTLRKALDRLTQDFAQSVVAAVRGATLGEFLSLQDRSDVRALPQKETRMTRLHAARRALRAHRLRGRPAPAHEEVFFTQSEPASDRADVPDEPPSPGTEIDAVAMLASLEGQAAVLEERPSPVPPILLTVPAADVGPTIALSAAAARAGEEILRTAGGSLVLRRRRGTQSAA
jgi:hypothetical protein